MANWIQALAVMRTTPASIAPRADRPTVPRLPARQPVPSRSCLASHQPFTKNQQAPGQDYEQHQKSQHQDAAHRERAQGVDVIVGYAEPHNRPETEALLEGLETLPPRLVSHRGVSLKEFDLDAALARRPQLILVDELAHTNAEGLRHAKRWQDVEELLEAGIDVWTTLNVQHVESLNDIIAQIRRVVVRETVPDAIREQTDE